MRDSFSNSLVDATIRDPRVYLLTGDHGYALFDALRKTSADKYINAGVAEQNMVGVAAGMAKMGLIPVVYGLAAFIPMRVLEQIKLDICFENLPVILIGDGAGVVYSKLGVSHQCSEDVSALRALPNIRILSPCDKYEMKLCMEDAVKHAGPTYIRVGKSDLGPVHTSEDFARTPGLHSVKAAKGDAPVILATGSMVKVAQNLIEKDFPDFGLVSVLQIKPMTEESLRKVIGHSRQIITIEEHNILGGLGSVVTEILSIRDPLPVLRIGIEDRFTDKCGTYEYLMHEHKLDSKNIMIKIKQSVTTVR